MRKIDDHLNKDLIFTSFIMKHLEKDLYKNYVVTSTIIDFCHIYLYGRRCFQGGIRVRIITPGIIEKLPARDQKAIFRLINSLTEKTKLKSKTLPPQEATSAPFRKASGFAMFTGRPVDIFHLMPLPSISIKIFGRGGAKK
jgi:hypothetical protein